MNPLEDVVTISIGGKDRELSYSMGSYRRLKKLFGKSCMSGELNSLDEAVLPEALFEGLSDKSGIADAEALAELIKPRMIPALMSAFVKAFYEQDVPEPDPNAQSSQQTLPA